ncbi:OmpA family protein [Spirochaeta isovalerica]|uniref:Outer membrane protein OmpA-like peptidoglycan-associated protein n=1 Tax=Spirochaeta isovalerica TaxID=150 RepID=A0A841R836_9SPIO|nr:OmpA family protein [Spirochaeta isovalerica]MBB6479129.1 outer membrane protein OmpA-like peptidoglycan-associated protein [Spirochaeta isovalerica]
MEKPQSVLIDDQAKVYFYPNRTDLTVDAKAVLDDIVKILTTTDNLDVEITGHCAFFGTEKGRQEISVERAENVYNYFLSKGWEPSRKPLLEGRGLQDLITRDPDKQNLNRRVEIRIHSS